MDSLKKIFIDGDEELLWSGRPDKKTFTIKAFINPLLPVALIWGIFDSFILSIGASDESDTPVLWFLIPFLLLHMMPVWVYLGVSLFSLKRYGNTEYAVTDRAIYVSGGTFTICTSRIPLEKLTDLSVSRGMIERRLGLGTINVSNGMTVTQSRTGPVTGNNANVFAYIRDYEAVYKLIKDKQRERSYDMSYPNALRPQNNDIFI